MYFPTSCLAAIHFRNIVIVQTRGAWRSVGGAFDPLSGRRFYGGLLHDAIHEECSAAKASHFSVAANSQLCPGADP